MNSLDENIKFTINYHTSKIPFLDTYVVKNGNILNTDVYYKPTDNKRYLHFHSCHPVKTKKNIPFTLAKRLCTIISDYDLKCLRLSQLHNDLKKLCYPENVINIGIQKALNIDRKELLKGCVKKEKNIVPFTSYHDPHGVDTYKIMKNNLNILTTDDKLKSILISTSIINCKKQPFNLGILFNSNNLITFITYISLHSVT